LDFVVFIVHICKNHIVQYTTNTMKRNIFFIIALTVIGWSCSKTVMTNRSSLNLIPTQSINSLSASEYRSYLSQNKTLKSGSQVDLVRRVGNDLRQSVEVYYKAIGKSSELQEFAWEFNVVDDPSVNAFCMAGGKVVVFTGILPVTQNEDALAVVMGHEIAHALANHSNERMSQSLLANIGLVSLDVAMSQKPRETRDLVLASAGVATQAGLLLPFSRKHESEADEIGLYLMTMAGYNPNEAALFWQRMGQGGGAPPEFLSTHPDPDKRSQRLKELVPKARTYAQKYPVPNSSKN
jgi:predicted Zn-dependent protease